MSRPKSNTISCVSSKTKRTQVVGKENNGSGDTLEEEEQSQGKYKGANIVISGAAMVSSGSGYGYTPVGLKNIGNTCFMNSIIQCIFATAPLTQYFMSKNGFAKECGSRSCRLSTSYCELLYKARKNKGGAITPSDLKSSVSRVARQFSGYGQQDS